MSDFWAAQAQFQYKQAASATHTTRIAVEVDADAASVSALLDILYTGRCEFAAAQLEQLCVLADRWRMSAVLDCVCRAVVSDVRARDGGGTRSLVWRMRLLAKVPACTYLRQSVLVDVMACPHVALRRVLSALHSTSELPIDALMPFSLLRDMLEACAKRDACWPATDLWRSDVCLLVASAWLTACAREYTAAVHTPPDSLLSPSDLSSSSSSSSSSTSSFSIVTLEAHAKSAFELVGVVGCSDSVFIDTRAYLEASAHPALARILDACLAAHAEATPLYSNGTITSADHVRTDDDDAPSCPPAYHYAATKSLSHAVNPTKRPHVVWWIGSQLVELYSEEKHRTAAAAATTNTTNVDHIVALRVWNHQPTIDELERHFEVASEGRGRSRSVDARQRYADVVQGSIGPDAPRTDENEDGAWKFLLRFPSSYFAFQSLQLVRTPHMVMTTHHLLASPAGPVAVLACGDGSLCISSSLHTSSTPASSQDLLNIDLGLASSVASLESQVCPLRAPALTLQPHRHAINALLCVEQVCETERSSDAAGYVISGCADGTIGVSHFATHRRHEHALDVRAHKLDADWLHVVAHLRVDASSAAAAPIVQLASRHASSLSLSTGGCACACGQCAVCVLRKAGGRGDDCVLFYSLSSDGVVAEWVLPRPLALSPSRAAVELRDLRPRRLVRTADVSASFRLLCVSHDQLVIAASTTRTTNAVHVFDCSADARSALDAPVACVLPLRDERVVAIGTLSNRTSGATCTTDVAVLTRRSLLVYRIVRRTDDEAEAADLQAAFKAVREQYAPHTNTAAASAAQRCSLNAHLCARVDFADLVGTVLPDTTPNAAATHIEAVADVCGMLTSATLISVLVSVQLREAPMLQHLVTLDYWCEANYT